MRRIIILLLVALPTIITAQVVPNPGISGGGSGSGTFPLGNYSYSINSAIANLAFGNSSSYVFVGSSSSGHDNLCIGLNACNAMTSGIGNLGIGHSTLSKVTSGINNLAVGWDSQLNNTTGNDNVSIGEDALKTLTTGNYNNAHGFSAGYSLTTGQDNQIFGENALYNGVTASYNVAIGSQALNALLGDQSVAIGYDALRFNNSSSTSSGNVAIGFQAGRNTANWTGTRNVFIGYQAGYYETGSNTLFIDDRSRTNEATSRTSSLIYGIFDATVTNQYLRINGALQIMASLVYGIGVPTISSGFGISPTIAGRSSSFRVTVGSGGATTGVVAFTSTFTNIPVCHANDEITANYLQAVPTTTQVTINGTMAASDTVAVVCIGY